MKLNQFTIIVRYFNIANITPLRAAHLDLDGGSGGANGVLGVHHRVGYGASWSLCHQRRSGVQHLQVELALAPVELELVRVDGDEIAQVGYLAGTDGIKRKWSHDQTGFVIRLCCIQGKQMNQLDACLIVPFVVSIVKMSYNYPRSRKRNSIGSCLPFMTWFR